MDLELNKKTNLQCVYPSFVYTKQWDVSKEWNNELYEIAKKDFLNNIITDPSNPNNIGRLSHHVSHIRHNFIDDYKNEKVVQDLIKMVDYACKEYLKLVYEYEHNGKVLIMSDTFWQRRTNGQNTGIQSHTHIKCDLVVTYYPKVNLDKDIKNPVRRGTVRVYDQANIGKRFWDMNNNSKYFFGGWYEVEIKEGLMLIIEGHVPHDSTYFEGDERMCIPMLVDIDTPKKHTKKAIEDILNEVGNK
jgi:hypothetical protein